RAQRLRRRYDVRLLLLKPDDPELHRSGSFRYGQPMPADKLVELGKTVSRRLRANPNVQVVEGGGADLFCYQNFLNPLECGGLIAMIDADRVPSTVYATNDDKFFRTSESCNLNRAHPFVHAI